MDLNKINIGDSSESNKNNKMTITEFFNTYGVKLSSVSKMAGLPRTRVENWKVGVSKPRNMDDVELLEKAIHRLGEEIRNVELVL